MKGKLIIVLENFAAWLLGLTMGMAAMKFWLWRWLM